MKVLTVYEACQIAATIATKDWAIDAECAELLMEQVAILEAAAMRLAEREKPTSAELPDAFRP